MLLPLELIVLLLSLRPIPTTALHVPWKRQPLPIESISNEHNDQLNGTTEQHAFAVQGVRKMSQDGGEMFFPEYWSLHTGDRPDEDSPLGRWFTHDERHPNLKTGNDSMLPPAQAAYAIHEPYSPRLPYGIDHLLRLPRALSALSKRDFQCPGGTTACKGIDRPNSCCQSGYLCKAITGSDGGDVGCCAEGADCGSGISDCAADQLSCPGNQGGGCCLPGYTCAGVGCAAASTATVTINPTVTALPSTTSAPSSSSSSSSSQVSVSTAATTSTRIETSSTTSMPPVVPVVRATSGSVSLTLTSTGPTTTYTPTSCPTGFYACNAHYLGGCCRIGRDCSSTTCPAPESSLVLSSNGVSIGVAPAVPTRLGEDGCALGWFRCDSGGGGGCCPSGFACGESCTATGVNLGAGVTGTAKVAKDNGNGGSRSLELPEWSWMLASALGALFMSQLGI